MPYESKLPIALGDLLAHARMVSFHVSKHAARFSAASERRIGLRTAKKLDQLVDELERIRSQRERIALGSSAGHVRGVVDVITTITMAARLVSKTHPGIAEQLARTKTANTKDGRSISAVSFSLRLHLDFFRDNKKVLGPLLPKTILKDGERALAALREHRGALDARRKIVEDVARTRAALLRDIRTIVGEVRELAAVLFRREPEIARQFQLPKRRPARSRKPPAEAPAPT